VRSRVDTVRREHRCGLRGVLHDPVAVHLYAGHRDQAPGVAAVRVERVDAFRKLGGLPCVVHEIRAERQVGAQREPAFLLHLRPPRQPVLDRAGNEHGRDSHAVGVGIRDPHELDLCCLRHRRNIATVLHLHVGEKSVRSALRVAADLAAGRHRRAFVDP
jgi:hypothetical protein